jgi:DNA polymerase III delta subunit
LSEDKEGWTRARDFLVQPALFVESKVLVLREAAREEHVAHHELIRREISSPKTFVIISDSEGPTPEFAFLLKESFQTHQFQELGDRDFGQFLLQEARARKLLFDDAAWQYFLRFVLQTKNDTDPKMKKVENGERLWRAIMELEKISLLAGDKRVTLADVTRHLEFTAQKNFYDLVGIILRGRDKKIRLTALEELLSSDFDPARIFNTLGFFANGAVAATLAQKDIRVKSGALDYESALLEFVI